MSPRPVWPWSALGLDGPAPLRDVKRAYAVRLKATDRSDPAAFQALQQVFDAARRMAMPDGVAARPSMVQILGGGVQNTQVLPDDAPQDIVRDLPTDVWPMQDTAPDVVTAPKPPQPMETHVPDTRAALVAEPVPVVPIEPVPPPAITAREAARSSGAASDDLDALHDSDPDRALTQFWQRFNAAVPVADSWKWEIEALDALLSLRLRHSAPGVNARIERHLFMALGASLDWSRAWVSNRVAVLLETHFAWVSDGVRFRRLFGNRDAFPLVAHALSQSLPRNGRAAADLARRPYRAMKGGILGLVLLISVWAMRRSPGAQADLPEALVSGALIGAILFVIAYYVLMVLLALVRVPIVAMGLDQPLLWLARRVAPGVVSDLERSGQTRSLWYWGLCAMAVALVMVPPYL